MLKPTRIVEEPDAVKDVENEGERAVIKTLATSKA